MLRQHKSSLTAALRNFGLGPMYILQNYLGPKGLLLCGLYQFILTTIEVKTEKFKNVLYCPK